VNCAYAPRLTAIPTGDAAFDFFIDQGGAA
jgi:hypothetical protein